MVGPGRKKGTKPRITDPGDRWRAWTAQKKKQKEEEEKKEEAADRAAAESRGVPGVRDEFSKAFRRRSATMAKKGQPRKETVKFLLHRHQADIFEAYFDPRVRVLCAVSGIQGGKSLLGALLLHYVVSHDKDPRAHFLVTSPDYKTMSQATRLTFNKIFKNLGTANEMKQEFTLHDGRKIFFRTVVKNPMAIEGVPNCKFIWADEAGLYPRMAWVNLQSRVALMGGKIILTTTPYHLNWLFHDVVKPGELGDPDIFYRRWPSSDNPAFSREEFERMREKLTPKEFERKFQGIHNKMEGLVFEDFDEGNWCDPFPLDPSWPVYGGIDWGFDHPLALVVRAFPDDGACYGVSLFKRSGLSTMQQLDLIQSKSQMFGVKLWYAGHDRPDMIRELNTSGISCVKYFEGRKEYREVNAGNQKHAELIRSKRYRVFKGLDQWEELRDEYETYSWNWKMGEEEKGEKEKPMMIHDDFMAAERYCTVGTFHLLTQRGKPLKIPADYHLRVDTFDPSTTRRIIEDWTDL